MEAVVAVVTLYPDVTAESRDVCFGITLEKVGLAAQETPEDRNAILEEVAGTAVAGSFGNWLLRSG